MLLAQPLQAEAVVAMSPAALLLVGGRAEDEVAARREALARERSDRDGVRRDLALHVERAAAPDLPVDQLAGERRNLPVGGIGVNDVGVAEKEERRPAGAGAAGDE